MERSTRHGVISGSVYQSLRFLCAELIMDDDKPKPKNGYQVLPKEAYLKKVKFFDLVLALALLSVINFSRSKTLHHVVDIFEFVICGGVIMMVFLNKDKIEKAYAKKTTKL